jgi:hypothetical protein
VSTVLDSRRICVATHCNAWCDPIGACGVLTGAAQPGKFQTPLRFEHVAGKERTWRLLEPLVYVSQVGRPFVADAGFVFDGASVPRPLWWWYPPIGGKYDEAAVLHDWLYAKAEHYVGDDHGHLSRGDADALMLEAMEATGVRVSAQRVIYSGVRAGGWRAWGKHRRRVRESSQP